MPNSLPVRVFIVDDEYVIAATLATILKRSGYAATYFTNPFEALARVEADSPDLLISDVVMPEMSGVDLAIHIRAACPRCKILLFSGQAQTANLLRAARDKGHDFALLTKPVHPADLLAEIGSLVENGKANESAVGQIPV
ncbi:response regulator [Acidisarcina polymorpha]|uniref:response regulator n=1 Tax=Acidisarcina polymorpha TaxID=2211140 RepID=UPI0039C8A3CB